MDEKGDRSLKDAKDNKETETTNTLPSTPESRPSIGVDVDYYQSIIDDPQASEDRKRELIELIGGIVVHFIDIGFGVHPVQLAHTEKTKTAKPIHQAAKERHIERSSV